LSRRKGHFADGQWLCTVRQGLFGCQHHDDLEGSDKLNISNAQFLLYFAGPSYYSFVHRVDIGSVERLGGCHPLWKYNLSLGVVVLASAALLLLVHGRVGSKINLEAGGLGHQSYLSSRKKSIC